MKKGKPGPALSRQVGGTHYTKLKIQPVEYIHANEIPYAEGTAIAYITRWRDKGGIPDLLKAIHTLELLVEFETREKQRCQPKKKKPKARRHAKKTGRQSPLEMLDRHKKMFQQIPEKQADQSQPAPTSEKPKAKSYLNG